MNCAQWIGTFEPMVVLPADVTHGGRVVRSQMAAAPPRTEPQYETYEPVTLVHGRLEPAADSPLMDA